MLGRLLVALVSLAALLGVGCNAPPIDVVRRTMGSLEAIVMERHERQVAVETSCETVGVRVTRTREEPREASSSLPLGALAVSSDLGRFRSPPCASLCAPHRAAWAEPSPTHAELMVFLN